MKNILKFLTLFAFLNVNFFWACPLCVNFSKEDKRPFFEQQLTKNEKKTLKEQKKIKQKNQEKKS